MGVVYVLRLPLLKAMRTLHGQLATKFKHQKMNDSVHLCNYAIMVSNGYGEFFFQPNSIFFYAYH